MCGYPSRVYRITVRLFVFETECTSLCSLHHAKLDLPPVKINVLFENTSKTTAMDMEVTKSQSWEISLDNVRVNCCICRDCMRQNLTLCKDAEVVIITEGDFKTFIRFVDACTARLFVSQVAGIRMSLLGRAPVDDSDTQVNSEA